MSKALEKIPTTTNLSLAIFILVILKLVAELGEENKSLSLQVKVHSFTIFLSSSKVVLLGEGSSPFFLYSSKKSL